MLDFGGVEPVQFYSGDQHRRGQREQQAPEPDQGRAVLPPDDPGH
jgi:hypothetical protein